MKELFRLGGHERDQNACQPVLKGLSIMTPLKTIALLALALTTASIAPPASAGENYPQVTSKVCFSNKALVIWKGFALIHTAHQVRGSVEASETQNNFNLFFGQNACFESTYVDMYSINVEWDVAGVGNQRLTLPTGRNITVQLTGSIFGVTHKIIEGISLN